MDAYTLHSGKGLTDIPDLSPTRLFVRPKASKLGKGYSKQIEFDAPKNGGQPIYSSDESSTELAELIEMLYVQRKHNILIGAISARSYESTLMRVWSQQWPQLRGAFSFCTGALSARGVGGRPFDVQCTHPSLVREISSAAVAKLSQEMNLLVRSDQQQPSWVARAVDDAGKPNGGPFRRLLWKCADDSDLKSFSCFAEIIERLMDSSERKASEFLGGSPIHFQALPKALV